MSQPTTATTEITTMNDLNATTRIVRTRHLVRTTTKEGLVARLRALVYVVSTSEIGDATLDEATVAANDILGRASSTKASLARRFVVLDAVYENIKAAASAPTVNGGPLFLNSHVPNGEAL